jgi:hypothetical protein
MYPLPFSLCYFISFKFSPKNVDFTTEGVCQYLYLKEVGGNLFMKLSDYLYSSFHRGPGNETVCTFMLMHIV